MKITLFVLFSVIAFSSSENLRADSYWKRHTIDASDAAQGKMGADGVRLGDINGDKIPDVVTGWENGNAIRVCINPGPEKTKRLWPGVTVGRVADAEDAVFADLDGDGHLDVVSSCEGKTQTVFVHWSPHDQIKLLDSSAWITKEFPQTIQKQKWMYAIPFDVNRDGAIDLIVGSKSKGGSISWLKNPGRKIARQMEEWELIPICEAGWVMSIRETDIDSNGESEILFSDRKGSRSGVFILRHLKEKPWFDAPTLLGCAGEEVMFLDVVDLNNDGRLDIATAIKPDKIAYLYQPKKTSADTWKKEYQNTGVDQKRFGTSKAVRVVGLHSKEGLDAIVTCENAKGELSGVLSITYNTGLLAGELLITNISGPEGVKFDRMELIDLDADGDLDIMTCEERDNLGVFWYENPAVP